MLAFSSTKKCGFWVNILATVTKFLLNQNVKIPYAGKVGRKGVRDSEEKGAWELISDLSELNVM